MSQVPTMVSYKSQVGCEWNARCFFSSAPVISQAVNYRIQITTGESCSQDSHTRWSSESDAVSGLCYSACYLLIPILPGRSSQLPLSPLATKIFFQKSLDPPPQCVSKGLRVRVPTRSFVSQRLLERRPEYEHFTHIFQSAQTLESFLRNLLKFLSSQCCHGHCAFWVLAADSTHGIQNFWEVHPCGLSQLNLKITVFYPSSNTPMVYFRYPSQCCKLN